MWPLLEFQWKALLQGPGWSGSSQHTGTGSFQEGQKTFNGEGADWMQEGVTSWLVRARIRAEVKGRPRAAVESRVRE